MGSPVPPLPQFVVLTTADIPAPVLPTQYQVMKRPLLSCIREETSSNRPKDRLEYIFTEASRDPTIKFAIERSRFDNELFHIRCCDNNKYIVRRKDVNATQFDFIDATATEPEEDTSLWTCTLFRREYVTLSHGFFAHRFRHVQSQKYISAPFLHSTEAARLIDLSFFSGANMDFIDWSSIVILPKQLIFKGDNGKYLAVVPHPNRSPNPSGVHGYTVQFCKDDPADASVKYELELMRYSPDGTLYIKSLSPGLTAPSDQTYWHSATQFTPPRPLYLSRRDRATHCTPVKVNANTIGLRTSNGRFLRGSSTQNDYLYDDSQTLVRDARIQVEEPVLSREIYNVRYRFEDSRVYDETPLVQIIANRENNTEQEHMSEVKYEFEEIRERFWRAFVSLELGVSMGFSVRIPLIGSLGFEVSTSFRGEYEWGETKTERWTFSDTYTFPVPPKTHVTAYMIASKGTCDIPFNYTVRDVLMDGRVNIYEAKGGVFTGVNSFNFGTKTESRPLDR